MQIGTRKESQTIAEGIAIKFPGRLNLAILRDVLDDMLIVNEAMIENAMQPMSDSGRRTPGLLGCRLAPQPVCG